MPERHHFPTQNFFMHGIAAVIAGCAFLITGARIAQTPPTASDNPMAGLTIDGTNAAPAKPEAGVATTTSQSFLGKLKGHLLVLKEGHLQTADAGALDGIKYITLLYENGGLKEGRGMMQTALPFYYSLKGSIRNTR